MVVGPHGVVGQNVKMKLQHVEEENIQEHVIVLNLYLNMVAYNVWKKMAHEE